MASTLWWVPGLGPEYPPALIHPAKEHQRPVPGTLCPEAAPLSGDSLYLAQASSFALSVFHSRTAWHG